MCECSFWFPLLILTTQIVLWEVQNRKVDKLTQREKTSRTEATEIVLAKIPKGEKNYTALWLQKKETLENQNVERKYQEQKTPPQ